MHVLVCSDYTFRSLGGIQTSVRAQCRELIRQGHQVTFVCPGSPDATEPIEGLSVVPVAPLPFLIRGYEFVLPTARTKRRFMEDITRIPTVDIIHCHTNMGVGVLAIAAAKALHVPLVQTFHGREDVIAEKNTQLPRLTAWFYAMLHSVFLRHTAKVAGATSYMAQKAWSIMLTHAEHADHITVPSHHFLEVFRQHGYAGSASVLPNGIDDSLAEKVSRIPLAAASQPRIIWVGRLWPEKQPELFVVAARLLPQYDFVMCGDGILRKEIEQNLPSNLTLHTDYGQTEILETMKGGTLFVHTSQGFDTQSMVLLEAAIAELPIIMLDKNLQETVAPPGSIVVDDDPQAIADMIQSTIENKDTLESMRAYLKTLPPKIVQSRRTQEAVALYNRIIHEPK